MVDTRKSKGATPQKKRLKKRKLKRALASSTDKERVKKNKKSNIALTSSPAKGRSNNVGDHDAGKSLTTSNNNNSTRDSDSDESSTAMKAASPSVDNVNHNLHAEDAIDDLDYNAEHSTSKLMLRTLLKNVHDVENTALEQPTHSNEIERKESCEGGDKEDEKSPEIARKGSCEGGEKEDEKSPSPSDNNDNTDEIGSCEGGEKADEKSPSPADNNDNTDELSTMGSSNGDELEAEQSDSSFNNNASTEDIDHNDTSHAPTPSMNNANDNPRADDIIDDVENAVEKNPTSFGDVATSGNSKGGDHESDRSSSPSKNNDSTGANDQDEGSDLDQCSDATDTTIPTASIVDENPRSSDRNRNRKEKSNVVEGSKKIRNEKGTTDDDVISSVRIKPYPPSFTFVQRFEVHHDCPWRADSGGYEVKLPKQWERKRRPAMLMPLMDWLQAPSTDTESKVPHHNLSTGLIGHGEITNALHSQTEFYYTQSLQDRLPIETHSMSPSLHGHPLSLITINIQPLVKKVDFFSNSLLMVRPKTRATSVEKETGNDLFIASTYQPASNFVLPNEDDLELVDYVTKNTECHLWHCSDLEASGMLRRAVASILLSHESSPVSPDWMSKNNDNMHFLGFASVYTKKQSQSVLAFTIQSFVLYEFDEQADTTIIRCLFTIHELIRSTMQDRLLQILQILQGIRHKYTKISFTVKKPSNQRESHLAIAGHMGFHVRSLPRQYIATRNHIIPMCATTTRVIWCKYAAAISVLTAREYNENFVRSGAKLMNDMMTSIRNDWHLFPQAPSSKVRADVMCIVNEVHAQKYDQAGTVPEEIDIAQSLIAPILKKAVQVTEIPMYVFTHLIAERMKANVTARRSNKKTHHRFRETFMQLLQHVTIRMTEYDYRRTHFRGDQHKVQLHCSTCNKSFGNVGNILQVLADARPFILFHYGLEPACVTNQTINGSPDVLEDKSFEETNNAEFQYFYNECPPLFSSDGDFYRSFFKTPTLIFTDDIESACRRGTNDKSHQHQFEDAVKRDAFHQRDESEVWSTDNWTISMIHYLFKGASGALSAYDKYLPDSENDDGDSPVEHNDIGRPPNNFGSKEDRVHEDVNDWKNITKAHIAYLNNAKRWCHLLDDLLIFNYMWLTTAVSDLKPDPKAAWNDHDGDAISYSKIGRYLRHVCISDLTELRAFRKVYESVKHDPPFNVASKELFLSPSAKYYRPIQYVMKNIAPSNFLKLGDGWHENTVDNWFAEHTSPSGVVRRSRKKNTMTVREAEEAMVIYRTVHRVKMVILEDVTTKKQTRLFKMDCDRKKMDQFGPEVQRRHRALFRNNEFVASDGMMKMLSKRFVDGLVVDTWKYLPSSYINTLKKSADAAEKYSIMKIQTWQTSVVLGDDNKYTPSYIYNVLIAIKGSTVKGKSSTQERWMLIDDASVLEDLSHERWLLCHLNTLASVSSYRTVVMGDGARAKPNNKACHKLPPDRGNSEDQWRNFWSDQENAMKFCAEGAVTNLLHHMSAIDEATTFKFYSTMDPHELCHSMGLEKLPKRVLTKSGLMKPVEKCLWLLCHSFKCCVTQPLRHEVLCSSGQIIKIVPLFRFPVLLSLVGTNSINDHVIVVWKSRIIDFEHEFTYPFNAQNLDFACGVGCSLLKVKFGCGIIPPKSIRKNCNKVGKKDWGGADIVPGGALSKYFNVGR